jgi:Rrf2 family transcriptional regulator, iron-sulfur cluster assembly transcription factor
MKLTTRGRYAVMAMVDLAQYGAEKPISLSEIADRQNISLSYLEQLFARLRQANLVQSTRGVNGGYLLTRPSTDIRVGEIVMAADEALKATRCTAITKGCMQGKKCATHDLWDTLSHHINFFLNSISLQDILNNNYGGIKRP